MGIEHRGRKCRGRKCRGTKCRGRSAEKKVQRYRKQKRVQMNINSAEILSANLHMNKGQSYNIAYE
jgi:uncharacterized metal-binding protein